MIVVTGATGRLGSQVVDRLLERVPAEQVGVSVRDPRQAAALAARGVRVRAGDFTDPDSLTHAFEGADQVLVISAAIRGFDAAVAANRAAIDAARAAGAGRILYTSHQAASPDSLFAPQHVHAATEQYLTESGAPFTALRNGFYASTLEHHLGQALRSGRLATPVDGPFSWTAHADLAEAAAVALAEPGTLEGITPPLTAPDTLDFAAVAALLGELTGREIVHTTVPDEQWTASAVENGMPLAAAEFTLGMFRAARRGEFDVTGPVLEKVIGRPATPARVVLQSWISRA